MPIVRAKINGRLLQWARETAGVSAEEAAAKVNVPEFRYADWEAGTAQPTIRQLRLLGNYFKRPIAVFYLPEVPSGFTPLRDYRRLPGMIAGVRSRELRLEIRRAHYRRAMALELFGDPDEVPSIDLKCRLTDDPDRLARRVRERLGISVETQSAWRKSSASHSFGRWRGSIEQLGALVLQMRGVDVSEAKGFSIAEAKLPVIVVNLTDRSYASRTFTLLHELTHLLLRQGGLCDLDDHSVRAPEELAAEVFCNQVAASILMPKEDVLALYAVATRTASHHWDDDELSTLSQRYGTSKDAFLRRLLTLGKTTQDYYSKKHDQFVREATERERLERERQRSRKNKSGPPPDKIALATAGNLFASLVMSSYYAERITPSDISDLLEVRLKHVPKIEAALSR
jgi:Zn-dependent peptidase ImmA (M78 family)